MLLLHSNNCNRQDLNDQQSSVCNGFISGFRRWYDVGDSVASYGQRGGSQNTERTIPSWWFANRERKNRVIDRRTCTHCNAEVMSNISHCCCKRLAAVLGQSNKHFTPRWKATYSGINNFSRQIDGKINNKDRKGVFRQQKIKFWIINIWHNFTEKNC